MHRNMINQKSSATTARNSVVMKIDAGKDKLMQPLSNQQI